jgi:predicted  nucleic acid-binding Zn-ribbon protein
LKEHARVLEKKLDAANSDRDHLAAEAAAARFSASEVILKFADMERALLHHDQSLRYVERKIADTDDAMIKRDTSARTLRVDVDALQRRVLCLRDHV